jgi:hypothetical protein
MKPMKRNAATLGVIALLMGNLATAQEQPREVLEQQARAFWEARIKGDWATVYDILSPEEKGDLSREQFTTLYREKAPFHFHSAQVQEVAIEDEFGWVNVAYSVRPSSEPDYPPAHVQAWNPWQRQDGQWHPLPVDQRGQLPKLPPHLRRTDEEAALSQRVHAFWLAKEKQDWARIYQFLDPAFRKQTTESQFLQRKAYFEYLSHRLEWTEVIDDQGRIKVAYTSKLNDPTLTKLEPKEEIVIEEWVKVDGQWYRRTADAQ